MNPSVPESELREVNFPGIKMQMEIYRTHELLSDIIRDHGKYSEKDLYLYDLILKPGDCFIDVGANIGWYSLYAALKVGTQGTVVAIEPEQSNFSLLVKNSTLNNLSQISALKGAAGSEKGERLLHKSNVNLGDHYFSDDAPDPEKKSDMVEVTTLDSIALEKNIQPRLVKIDVQGWEPEVLAGMKQILKSTKKPFLLVEYAPWTILRSKGSPFEIFSFIEKNNYVPYQMGREYSNDPIITPLTIQDLLNFTQVAREEPEYFIDLLLIPGAEHDSFVSEIK